MNLGELSLDDLEKLRDEVAGELFKRTKVISWDTPIGAVIAEEEKPQPRKGVTTDRNDPRLGRGVDTEPIDQHDVYLVLSEEERAKGFVRPYRDTYRHVGIRPKFPTRPLKPEEIENYKEYGWIEFEEYPDEYRQSGEVAPSALGRYWSKADLESGCQTTTSMSRPISETYARNPKFYGSTYCCSCRKHLPVEEFVWYGTNDRVGS